MLFLRWQARKEGDRNMRAGLIPSRALQERRIIHERTQAQKDNDNGKLFVILSTHFSAFFQACFLC